jgi:DNA polymerase-3 subunit delta'
MHDLSKLPSLKEPRLLLERALTSGKLPPTWLITGPEGSGKWALGMELARALLCSGDGPWGCGRCPSCQRVLSFSHSDLFLLFAFPTGGGTGKARTSFQQDFTEAFFDLKKVEPLLPHTSVPGFEQRNRYVPVERVTDLLNWARLKPSEGAHKVALLYEPELIVRTVTDKLLKLTEEPPADTTLILVSHRPELLPQTIRSRARVARTQRMGPRQLEEFLVAAGHPTAAAANAARLSRGLVGPALFRLAQETDSNLEKEALDLLGGLWSGSAGALSQLQEWQWKGAREKTGDVLDVWATLVRDVACQSVSRPVLATPAGALTGKLAGLSDPRRAEGALREIRHTQAALVTNVHIGVALCSLAAKLGSWGQGRSGTAAFWPESQLV